MFFTSWIEMGGFELNHHWHGINVLSILECCLLAAVLCSLLALFAVRKSKRLATLSLVGALSFATAAYAANTALSGLTASGALAGANLIYVVQTVGVGGVKATMTQVATFINSLFSGDATVASGGAVTLATVNANVGSFGSTTTCVSMTVNAKGLITAASAATCAPAVGSITGFGTGVATALGVNINTAGSVLVNGGGLGTPSSGVATNLTGTATGLTAGNVTTNANLTGMVTSVGNAASLGSFTSANLAGALTDETGSGAAVFGTAPTMSSPTINTALTLGFLTGAGTECMQVSNTGVVSGTGSACGGSGSTGANPTATAGPTAVNGSATTFMRSDGAPAVQKASSSVFGIVEVDNITITASAGVISAVGPVASVTGSIGVTCSPTTGSVVCSTPATRRDNTATTDTITSPDKGTIVTESNASAVAVAITTAGFVTTDYFTIKNLGAGLATYTPSSGTVNGAATIACATNQSADLYFDGTNYKALGNTCQLGALATVAAGSNVATAAAVALSGAGGLTSTIASGTATVPATLIASGACGSAITVSAANVATTDVVTAGFNADPTAVTGFTPAAMLTIIPYPTSGNVNFKACNLTGSGITPTSTTFNWRVVR